MNRTIIITEVREKLLGYDAEQMVHARRLLGWPDEPKLGMDLHGCHLVVWRMAFYGAKQAEAWGEDCCRILKRNYPEREYEFKTLRVGLAD